MAHTPGPWTSASGSVWKGDPFTDPEGAYKIGGADRDEARTLPVERDDNVQLMATAPDLQEVAEETLVAFENVMPKHLYKNGCFNWETQPDNCPCLAHKIRAAINKATA